MSEEDKKIVTSSELKNWLSGVLDFQPADWVPDAGQWVKILDKINSLDDTPPQPKVQTRPAFIEQPQQQPPQQQRPRNPRPQAPLDGNNTKLPPPKPRAPDQMVVQQSGPSSITGEGDTKVTNTGTTYKTGTIDTSDGEYTSQFK